MDKHQTISGVGSKNFSHIYKITKVAPSIVKNWHYNYFISNTYINKEEM